MNFYVFIMVMGFFMFSTLYAVIVSAKRDFKLLGFYRHTGLTWLLVGLLWCQFIYTGVMTVWMTGR